MHDPTSAGSWGPRGLQRQVRATVATGLAAMAAVLSAASSVADTIAKELRLSLDEEVELPPPTRDVARRAEPITRPSGPIEPAEPADAEGPTVRIVDASARAARPGASVAPEPAPAASADAAPDGAAPGSAQAGGVDGPSPWVDDVAAEVAGGTVRDALARLPSLTPTQLRALERHERANRGRVTLLRAVGEELTRRG